MFASGERDSNWSTRTVPVVRTMNISSSDTNSAYWPRFLTMSSISSRLCCPLSKRMIRASRDSRARRNSAVNRKNPRVGIEPSRSSQPRRRMKYSLRGDEPVMLYRKSARNTKQIALSNHSSVSCVAGLSGRITSAITISDITVRTRMKIS